MAKEKTPGGDERRPEGSGSGPTGGEPLSPLAKAYSPVELPWGPSPPHPPSLSTSLRLLKWETPIKGQWRVRSFRGAGLAVQTD